MRLNKLIMLIILILAALFPLGLMVRCFLGAYAFNTVLQRGASYWLPIDRHDTRLSPSIRLALSGKPLDVVAAPPLWKNIAPGFEVTELPVLHDGVEVDRLMLARIDPVHFRFIVRNDPSGSQQLDAWMKTLGAVLVVNGSYYAFDGTPDTPILSDGHPLGPPDYQGSHGAFVSGKDSTEIVDLARESWHEALQNRQDAMVSYPLLVAADGSSRVGKPSQWLANRSFVAQDKVGRILIGTTKEAFFSLDRLALFLKNAPLDIRLALNLDGGPVACQGISLGGFERRVCGRWEIQADDQKTLYLTSLFNTEKGWGLPMVLAVVPK